MLQTLRELIKLLPAGVARLLLLVTLLGAATLHTMSMRRIEALEKDMADQKAKYDTMMRVWVPAVQGFAEELKLYRAAVVDENKRLKDKGSRGR
jgi:hypothetical protein